MDEMSKAYLRLSRNCIVLEYIMQEAHLVPEGNDRHKESCVNKQAVEVMDWKVPYRHAIGWLYGPNCARKSRSEPNSMRVMKRLRERL